MPPRDLITIHNVSRTPAEFNALSDIPPELEWLANITNLKTRRAYKVNVAEFLAFSGLSEIKSLRAVARSHVIAWRKDILDRLVHNAHRIEMRGESMRKKRNPPQDEKKE